MKDEFIMYRCKICNKRFILPKIEVQHSEEESKFITCPFHGRHKDIVVIGRYDNLKECMEQQSVYKRRNGRVVQIK